MAFLMVKDEICNGLAGFQEKCTPLDVSQRGCEVLHEEVVSKIHHYTVIGELPRVGQSEDPR